MKNDRRKKQRGPKDTIKEINNQNIENLTDNQIVENLQKIFKIKKVVYNTHKKIYFNNFGGYHAPKEGEDERENMPSHYFNKRNQFTISGHPNFSIENGDYDSLCNKAYNLAIINYKRCLKANEILDSIEEKISQINANNPEAQVNFNRKEAEKSVKSLELIDLTEQDVVDLSVVRVNRLILELKELGIQKVRKIKSMRDITSYAIQTFKHKFISEGLSPELRRKTNRNTKPMSELYKEDYLERESFLDHLIEEKEENEGEMSIMKQLLTLVDSDMETDEVVEELKFKYGNFAIPEERVVLLIEAFRKDPDNFGKLRLLKAA
jgi:hypothetical protein